MTHKVTGAVVLCKLSALGGGGGGGGGLVSSFE